MREGPYLLLMKSPLSLSIFPLFTGQKDYKDSIFGRLGPIFPLLSSRSYISELMGYENLKQQYVFFNSVGLALYSSENSNEAPHFLAFLFNPMLN